MPLSEIRPSTKAEIANAKELESPYKPPRRLLDPTLREVHDIVLESGSATLNFEGEKALVEAFNTRHRLVGSVKHPEWQLKGGRVSFTLIEGENDTVSLVVRDKKS